MAQRKLTVGKRIVEDRKRRNCTGLRPVPLIRLCGDWLQEAGFRVQDQIVVEIKPDHIILRREDRP